MSVVGLLLVNLRASTAAFASDLGKARELSFKNAKEIERSFKILGGSIVGGLSSLAITASALVKQSINTADAMGKMAQSTGLSVEQFSGLASAAKLSNIEAGTLSTGLIALSKNLEKSNRATQEGQAAHSALGTLFKGNVPIFKDTNTAFFEISQALSELPNKTQQVALANQIFGRSLGEQVIPMIKDGAAGITTLIERLTRLGVVISEDTFKKAEAFNDNLTMLGFAVSGLGTRLAGELLPYLLNFSNKLVNLASETSSSQKLMDSLATSVQVLATAVIGAAGAVVVFTNAAISGYLAIKALATAIPIVGSLFGDFDKTIKALNESDQKTTAAFKSVKEILEAIWNPLQNATLAARDLHVEMKKLAEGKFAVPDMAAWIKTWKQPVGEVIGEASDKLKAFIKNLEEEVKLFGKSSKEVAIYKAAQLGADQATQKLAGSLAHQLDLMKEMTPAMKALSEVMPKPTNAPEPLELGSILLGTPDFSGIKAPDIPFNLPKVDIGSISKDVKTLNDELKKQAATIEKENRPAIEKYNEALDSLQVLRPWLSVQAYDAEVLKLKDTFLKTNRVVLEVRQATSEMFTRAIFRADGFRDAIGNILERIAELIFQIHVMEPLLNNLFGSTGGSGGLFGKIFGSILGGIGGGLGPGGSVLPLNSGGAASIPLFTGLQHGGAAQVGKTYLVGEKGPELFIPNMSGEVVPNGKMGTVIADMIRGIKDKTVSMISAIGDMAVPQWSPSPVHRQFGGPAMAGSPYMVGEAGPEIFWPSQSGHIQPNTGNTFVYNIDARGAQRGVSGEIAQALKQTEDRAVLRSRIHIKEDKFRKS